MLSMKTLRVAIVAMGSALFLGSGVAVAQQAAVDINLDAVTPQPVVMYAVETMTATATHDRVNYYTLGNASAVNVMVTAGAALDSDFYVRLALSDGMIFNTAPTAGTGLGTLVVGGIGDNVAVFAISTIANDAPISIDVQGDLAVSSKEPGSYSASISVHRDQFDAYDNVGAISSRLVGGSATIVSTVRGIDAAITPARGGTVADVGQGFLWFIAEGANLPNPSIGTVKVAHRRPSGTTVLSAVNGSDISGLIGPGLPTDDPDGGGVTIAIEGNLGIGVWNLIRSLDDAGMSTDDAATADVDETACPLNFGSQTDPVDPAEPGMNSNLALDADDPNMAMASDLMPGTYKVCVTVDLAGSTSNMTPIPAGEYMATAYSRVGHDIRDDVMVAEGTVGRIIRNGTTVNIAYLTDSEKYNQRLIIVNRGSRPAMYDLHSFTMEVGSDTMAELSPAAMAAVEAGLNVIPPGGQVVLPVADILTFSGDRKRRVGATLSINADVTDVQVATTQVNLEDGSTDTVVYASEGGAEVN